MVLAQQTCRQNNKQVPNSANKENACNTSKNCCIDGTNLPKKQAITQQAVFPFTAMTTMTRKGIQATKIR